MDFNSDLSTVFFQIAGVFTLLLTLGAALHVVFVKTDPRSALYWLCLLLLSPLLGIFLYLVFGINRIQRRGRRLGVRPKEGTTRAERADFANGGGYRWFRYGDVLSLNPVVRCPEIETYVDGDLAYKAMLEAIQGARTSIALETYIYNWDRAGIEFGEALEAAVQRGVEVRVLVDGAGGLYSFPRMAVFELQKMGINAREFLPTRTPWSVHFGNLRLHRKLLIVDGVFGFTGGMNISEENTSNLRPKPTKCSRDLQFRFSGDVVRQMFEAFATDWDFATEEVLDGEVWNAPLAEKALTAPTRLVRVVADGPDETGGRIRGILFGNLSEARESIRIVTPYFLPDQSLVDALNAAAYRGVDVEIFTPKQNDLPWVRWAMQGQVWRSLNQRCKLYLVEGDFDHSKITVVDGQWVFLGSANWDVRSFRLNYELNVEVVDPKLAATLEREIDRRRKESYRLLAKDLESRPVWLKFRDSCARLFSPML